MTGLFRVFDAAIPPATAPPGCQGVLGYIGGARAARVWTLPEWDRFSTLAQFPAYVPDVTLETPAEAAAGACERAEALGWAPYQALWRVIVFDLETQVVPGWYQQCASQVGIRGFTAMAYGSLSTVLANAASDVWAAAWDGSAVLLPGQTIHAHQYQSTPDADFSVVDEWLFNGAGTGPRHS